MHHAQRWNVTTFMVGLWNGHIRKNLTKNEEPQRYSWERRRRRRNTHVLNGCLKAHTHTHTHTHTHMPACAHTRTHTHTHKHTRSLTHTHTHTHTCLRAHTHTHTQTHTLAHTHTHTHIHTHTHTHTHSSSSTNGTTTLCFLCFMETWTRKGVAILLTVHKASLPQSHSAVGRETVHTHHVGGCTWKYHHWVSEKSKETKFPSCYHSASSGFICDREYP